MTTPPLIPNFTEAWEFLLRFHPGRPVVVTGISIDKKLVPTETFFPGERDRFLPWVEAAFKSDCNLYFSVGEPTARATAKLKREELKAVHWLHVDVDPRVVSTPEELAAEQVRILGVLRSPPEGVPPPTVIVYSGGGYQGYWKLAAPIPIDGSIEAAEDAKLYNLQLERMFGGDHCHDVSRIMRLPGTINIPDAKKKKKGRVPALAAVIEFHDDRVYEIAKFIKAQPVQGASEPSTSASAAGPAPRLRAPANVKRLERVDELGDKVSNACKVTIAQGSDPDKPDRFGSRSEAVFWVTCELVRACLTDEVIYSVLTDKEFRISESILEKGGGADRYALRQIERARERAIDPILQELNDRHAVIENMGGECLVIEELFDSILNRHALTKQSFSAFRNRYMNRSVRIGSKMVKEQQVEQTMPAGEWWLRHQMRRQYRSVVFAPGKDVPDCYNLWRGFTCEARPGDCSIFLGHVRDIVCGGSEMLFDYVMGWMANVVQRPAEQGHSAIAMRGAQGSGKSTIPTILGRLLGRHYLPVTNEKHFVGNFNAHLRDCVLLFADEAFYAGDKKHESILKTLITEPTLLVEPKGVDAETAANCVHLMMASNERWIIPAGYDDRRFLVLDVKADRVGDFAYFRSIFDQMNHGGYEALLHLLLSYDLSKYNVRSVPKTEALREQKLHSMPAEDEWWLTLLRRGTLLLEHDCWHSCVATDLLLDDFVNYTRGFNLSKRGNQTKLGLCLSRLVPGGVQRRPRRSPVTIRLPNGQEKVIARPYYYEVPPLAQCREHFDDNYGGPFQWDDDLPEDEVPDYSEPPPPVQTEIFQQP